MSDDIDIEEHDLLDNPILRRIFPDLSVIKKEICQYEEGLSVDDEEADEVIQEVVVDSASQSESIILQPIDATVCSPASSEPREITDETFSKKQLEVRLRFKHFLDSLVDDFMESSESNSGSQSDILNDIIPSSSPALAKLPRDKALQSNVVILGSKPAIQYSKETNKHKQIRQLKIVLKNVTPYLNASKRYCKHCFILFPDVDKFNSHMNNAHLHKSNNIMYNIKNQIQLKKFQCEICAINVSTKANLVRHFKRIHKLIIKPDHPVIGKRKLMRGNTKVNKTISLKEAKYTKSMRTLNCFHCQKSFESQSSLIEHLYDVLNPKKTASRNATKNENPTQQPDSVIDSNKDDDNLITSQNKEYTSDFKFSTQSKQHNNDKVTGLNHKIISKSKKELQLENIAKTELNQTIKYNENAEKKDVNEGKLDNYLANQTSVCLGCDNEQTTSAENVSIHTQKKLLYQCFICSQYMTYFKLFSRHMDRHNLKNVAEVDRITFDAKCKFCSREIPTIKSYNRHITRIHRKKYLHKVKLEENAFQSVLFKCFKCAIFFLSANDAKSHSKHNEIYLNWECLDCDRQFKIKDKPLHLKQHSLSKNIISYILSESALNLVLCKCLKCTVHFSEKEYFLHNTCDLEIPNSAYCNTCDILINRNDMEIHEKNHKENKLQLFDFTLIESDIIMNNKKKCNDDKIINPYAGSKLALTFCYNCNCFVYNLGTTHKVHIDGSCCNVISPRTCRKCGLIFTSSAYQSHKKLHDKVHNLNMQAFYFYDIKSKEQIRPPIPKYPNCSICQVHFLNISAIKGHECSIQSFKMCNICKTKYTDAAFRLHINYHNYKLSATIVNKKEMKDFKEGKAAEAKSDINNINSVVDTSLKEENSDDNVNVKVQELKKILYTCMNCQITVDMYDKVVQHCQEHYDYPKLRPNYKNTNSCEQFEEKSHVTIEFDPFYLRFNYNAWIKHIFENLTQVEINYVLQDSMYKFECRLKMEQIQSGSNSIALYKCDICRSFIDPKQVYTHAYNTCNVFTRKYPCLCCGLCFYSQSYRSVHEKCHKGSSLKASSFRIILFNKIEHQHFHKMMFDSLDKFIMYQCRNCEAIVDKLKRDIHQCHSDKLIKCKFCGLVFNEKQFNLHVIKHETVKQFKIDNMVVIMFGKLVSQTNNGQVKSSFIGKIIDLTFYRCTNCDLCLKSNNDISNHVCVLKSYLKQCAKCYLCFMKKEIREHSKFHENNLELGFDDFNSNIITFTNKAEVVPQVSLTHKENENAKNTTVNNILTQTIYKCSCGLHFLEKINAGKHQNNCSPKMKISKQSCIKCDLIFTPGDLFDHLLKHHGDKKLQYKYDIVNIPESTEQS